MKKEPEFIKNSVKNDLRRVSKWAVEVSGELPQAKIKIFLQKASQELGKLNDPHSKNLLAELRQLHEEAEELSDPLKRIHWAEKILTLSCRL